MNYSYAPAAAASFVSIYFFVLLLSLGLSIACYVLRSLGMYTIAKRRAIDKPWLAWIPVANAWLAGALSDQYRYVACGQERSKRKSLLILSILNAAAGLVVFVLYISVIVNLTVGLMSYTSEYYLMQSMIGTLMGILGMCVVMLGLSIAYAVIYYMALYDIFKSLDPDTCVLFLVLSILFGVTEPFFLFFNRNKDLGMPPRREQPVYAIPEPWENQ